MTTTGLGIGPNEVLARLSAAVDLDYPSTIARSMFLSAIGEEGLRFLRNTQLATGEEVHEVVGALGETICEYSSTRGPEWVVRSADDSLVWVDERGGGVSVTAAASTPTKAARLIARIERSFAPPVVDPEQVAGTFWAQGANGPQSVHRKVACPAWAELLSDHGGNVRPEIDSLMGMKMPSNAGLVLLHGLPGTGKTFVVRALAREWSEWCIPHFITDPDQLLNDSGYLLSVLTATDRESNRDRGWRLIVLEDAGEMLGADAQQRAGQAVSKLLNVTDGVLGQGMSAIVLVTTNEPLACLHPALVRPGRCLAEIEFQALSVAEANAWLAARQATVRVTSPTTLAELHALVAGRAVPSTRQPIGFAA